MISEQVWNEAILKRSYDIEFDWFGIDKNGILAIFSTFGRGYTPELVKKSRFDYIKVASEIENLPFICKANLITKSEGRFDDWLEYSQQGIIAFDYQDVHRNEKTGNYDLISKPEELITVEQIGLKSSLINKIPKFNLNFDVESSIAEIDLKINFVQHRV